eukprot:6942052-Prymnesium_polylepis.1
MCSACGQCACRTVLSGAPAAGKVRVPFIQALLAVRFGWAARAAHARGMKHTRCVRACMLMCGARHAPYELRVGSRPAYHGEAVRLDFRRVVSIILYQYYSNAPSPQNTSELTRGRAVHVPAQRS